jgi:CspA family cold shock protein
MTRAPLQDQLRYCERCGISFLWSGEEQAEAQADAMAASGQGTAPRAPLHCAGCRALLPGTSRERGLVKWFNYRKRFGFIVRQHQPEVFVHGTDVLDNAKLRPGDLVEFSVEESERGLVAKAIRVLASEGE